MRLTVAALAAAVALITAGCSSTADPDAAGAAQSTSTSTSTSDAATGSASPAPTGSPTPAPTAGAWIDLAAYEADRVAFHAQGDVVLFFNASWCPSCRATVGNLDKQGVPPGLTVVSVDFDAADALRRQHGVSVQHTFVQVDADGQRLAKFTGSLTGAQIAAQTV